MDELDGILGAIAAIFILLIFVIAVNLIWPNNDYANKEWIDPLDPRAQSGQCAGMCDP